MREPSQYSYIPLIEPLPISEQKWPKAILPLVSIGTLTYNHGDYIRKCLEGLLMQKTTFPVRICVFEDCSTDKTATVIEEFQQKYPDLIFAFLQPENTWGTSFRNKAKKPYMDSVYVAKYVALCEGDDYWTDPLKLQKQVDFLEANSDYGLVHTDANVYYQNTGKLVENVNRLNKTNLVQLDNPAEELILGNYRIYTLTTMFRSSLIDYVDPEAFRKFKMGDLPLWLTFTQFTKFFYLDDSTAVYRKSEGSASNPANKKAKLDFKISSKEVRLSFAKSLNLKASTVNKVSDQYNRAVLSKKFEVKESAMALKVFSSIHKKTIKDVILLLGCKSKIFNTIVKKALPNMS